MRKECLSMTKIILGDYLTFAHDPFLQPIETSLSLCKDGAIIVKDGLIVDLTTTQNAKEKYPDAMIEDYRGHILSPGFVDCHIHFPQYHVIASYGEQLLEWLNKYTFPTEMKFQDRAYADKIAPLFIKELFKNGTTCASAYCTAHAHSADALFTEAQKYNARMLAGKVWMDRHAPPDLCDNPQSAYDDAKQGIKDWHGKDRLSYVLTPRFAPTSTEAQLEMAGSLWAEHPDLIMQTHLSENKNECAWVQELFPDSKDYLDVYDKYGLLKKGGIFGHGIYLSEDEKQRIYDADASIAHCPTSNMFIGSGLFPLFDCKDNKRPLRVGLATDVGGGSSFSMFATMRCAYEVAQLLGHKLHPYQAWYLATWGSAHSLHIDDKVGNIKQGMEADIIAINLESTDIIAEKMSQIETVAETLFAHMILADERAIAATFVAGNKVCY